MQKKIISRTIPTIYRLAAKTPCKTQCIIFEIYMRRVGSGHEGFHEDTQMARHLEQVHQTGTIQKREFKSNEANHIKTPTRRYKACTSEMRNEHERAELCRKKLFKKKTTKTCSLTGKNRPNDVIKRHSNYLYGKCTEGFEQEVQLLVLYLKDSHNIDIVYCLNCDLPLENENSRSQHVVKYHMQQE